ncbi:hypothetical protein [Ignatzschineria cameli]|uniref:Uncharacterized protein n=1 Tax=Ignatzschineria cameli TaxID=2182793 RepID=A0A2U2AQM6_9GAMM|nr:hypothetical protein [Ignatzschineria cameli]PWD85365.1 hypothetical protein DC080_06825 [Ignatzschineria cameli]PWD86175.1 hypothetical protein DC077_05375 [Ignatzschineria cameli]
MDNLSRKQYWILIILYLLFFFGLKFLIVELLDLFPDFTIWLTNLIIVPLGFVSFLFAAYLIYYRVSDFSNEKIVFALFFAPTAITYFPDLLASFKVSFLSSIHGNAPLVIRYFQYQQQAYIDGFLGFDYQDIALVSIALLFILGLIPSKKQIKNSEKP